jgi:hypothetical protein
MNQQEAIKLWKEKGVERAVFVFNCGGDNMGDTDLILYGKNEEEIVCQELKDFLDDETYKNVDFYVNSDGHYMGEAGTVDITLNEDDDEPFFDYCKSSQSEWSETVENIIEIELNEKQLKFIKDNVSNINGGKGGGVVINYKRDFIMTDEEEKIAKEIEVILEEETSEFHPHVDGKLSEWYNFTTNEDGGEITTLTTTETGLKVLMNNSVTVYKDE